MHQEHACREDEYKLETINVLITSCSTVEWKQTHYAEVIILQTW